MQLRPSRRAESALATLLLVVAACGPTDSPSPGPTTGVSPTAGTPATASPSVVPTNVVDWQRNPDQRAFEDLALRGVIWTGSRFLATELVEPVLFDSVDGRTWHRQPPFKTTGRSSGPHLVAAGPDGLVAVGGGSNVELVLWRSTDGLTWSSVPDQDAFHSRDGAFQGVAGLVASASGWTAIGSEFYMCVPTCPLRGIVLTSNDGAHWTRLAEQPELRHAEIHGIARGPSGFVAVGTRLLDPEHADAGLAAALWTSPDGRDWAPVGQSSTPGVPELPGWSGPTDVALHGVAVRGERVVVLGDVRPSSGSSPEGYVRPVAFTWSLINDTWTAATVGASDGAQSLAVVPLADEFVAITGSAPDCASGLWASEDGALWQCAGTGPAFAGYVVTGGAASPDLEVLVGHSLTDPVVGAVWTRAVR